jgi:hypothetical protein
VAPETSSAGIFLLSSTASVESLSSSSAFDMSEEELARAFASNLLDPIWSRHRQPLDTPAHLQLALLIVPASSHHDNVVVHAEATLASAATAWEQQGGGFSVEIEVDYLHPPQRFGDDPDHELLSDLEQLGATLTICARGELDPEDRVAAMLNEADEGAAECLLRSATERGFSLSTELTRHRIVQTGNDSLALAAIAHEARLRREDLGSVIVERCASQDAPFLIAVLPALASFRGPDVVGFVEALAAAHPAPLVRASASEWLTNAEQSR